MAGMIGHGTLRCRVHIGTTEKAILFLCEESGKTEWPWREAGFSTVCIDLAVDGQDVRLIGLRDLLLLARHHRVRIVGCFAMPPCTHFAGSGARWWEAKGEAALLEALSVSDAFIRIAASLRDHGLRWFALENPLGRLRQFLGKPVMTFQPFEFGDPYSKRTCLWGWGFNTTLPKSPIEPTESSKMWKLAPSTDRARLRSETPAGFASAICDANKTLSA